MTYTYILNASSVCLTPACLSFKKKKKINLATPSIDAILPALAVPIF